MKPAQGELNAALSPLFAYMPDAHIHDDVVIATDTVEEHQALKNTMDTISEHGLTLNPAKCHFLQKEIKF